MCLFTCVTMKFLFVKIGAWSMAFVVLMGAFGAHILKDVLSEYYLEIFQKAVYYQALHSLGLILIGMLLRRYATVRLVAAGWLMLSGIALFSGSLYLLVATEVKALGMITPLGGILFVLSWSFFASSFGSSLCQIDRTVSKNRR